MKAKLILWALALAYFGTSAAHAAGRLAEIAIVDRDRGTRLEAHYYHGEYWIAGQPGARYAIYLRSRVGERLLAVSSVDGINVLSGETASWQQGGYVLAPGEDYEITGWRKSDDQVAAFAFTAPPHSYAARTGRPDNLGVIGVALFRERPIAYAPPVAAPDIEAERRSQQAQRPSDGAARGSESASGLDSSAESAPAADATAPIAPAAQAAAPGSAELGASTPQMRQYAPALGTAHGGREYSYVAHTTFARRRPVPDEVIRIRYDSLDNLIAMGIVRPARNPVRLTPNPFPDSSPQLYVPDPPPEPFR